MWKYRQVCVACAGSVVVSPPYASATRFRVRLARRHTESIQCLAYNPVTMQVRSLERIRGGVRRMRASVVAQLASGTALYFGLWSPESKHVQKFKTGARVLCTGWTNDGLYLALGQFNGARCARAWLMRARPHRMAAQATLASATAKRGRRRCVRACRVMTADVAAQVLIERKAPVWCLAWSPPAQRAAGKSEVADTLAVGCWDQTLSFYHLSGQQVCP